MKKIVVTTDLSKSSKAGLRFAIQLASQYEVKLIFFHAIELLVPTRWNDVKAKIHMDEEIGLETRKLRNFVTQTYKECKRRPGKFDCVVRYGAPVSRAVLEYASEIHANYICMSTRGAGRWKRLIGTHTSAVIMRSSIPVFAIPKNYRASSIKEILYASDFGALKRELRTVNQFARELDSSVSVVHYDYFVDPKATRTAFNRITNQPGLSGIRFHLAKFNWEKSVSWHLGKSVKKFQADLLALFTDHKRPWLQRALEGSRSAEASFDVLKPLLVYPK